MVDLRALAGISDDPPSNELNDESEDIIEIPIKDTSKKYSPDSPTPSIPERNESPLVLDSDLCREDSEPIIVSITPQISFVNENKDNQESNLIEVPITCHENLEILKHSDTVSSIEGETELPELEEHYDETDNNSCFENVNSRQLLNVSVEIDEQLDISDRDLLTDSIVDSEITPTSKTDFTPSPNKNLIQINLIEQPIVDETSKLTDSTDLNSKPTLKTDFSIIPNTNLIRINLVEEPSVNINLNSELEIVPPSTSDQDVPCVNKNLIVINVSENLPGVPPESSNVLRDIEMEEGPESQDYDSDSCIRSPDIINDCTEDCISIVEETKSPVRTDCNGSIDHVTDELNQTVGVKNNVNVVVVPECQVVETNEPIAVVKNVNMLLPPERRDIESIQTIAAKDNVNVPVVPKSQVELNSIITLKEKSIFESATKPAVNQISAIVNQNSKIQKLDLLNILHTVNSLSTSDFENHGFVRKTKETFDYGHQRVDHILNQRSFCPIVHEYNHQPQSHSAYDNTERASQSSNQAPILPVIANNQSDSSDNEVDNEFGPINCEESESVHEEQGSLRIDSPPPESVSERKEDEDSQTEPPQYKSRWEKIMERKIQEKLPLHKEKVHDRFSKDYFPAKSASKQKPVAFVKPCTQTVKPDRKKSHSRHSSVEGPSKLSKIKEKIISDDSLSKKIKDKSREKLKTSSLTDSKSIVAHSFASELLKTIDKVSHTTHKSKHHDKYKSSLKGKTATKISSSERSKSTSEESAELFAPDKLLKISSTKHKNSVSKADRDNADSRTAKQLNRTTNRGGFLTDSLIQSVKPVGKKKVKDIKSVFKTKTDELHSMINIPDIEIHTVDSLLSKLPSTSKPPNIATSVPKSLNLPQSLSKLFTKPTDSATDEDLFSGLQSPSISSKNVHGVSLFPNPENFHKLSANNRKRTRQTGCVCLPPRNLKASVGSNVFDTMYVLYLILEWNVDWLVQQSKNPEPPPISKLVHHVKSAYEDFDDYYNTYFPLLLLETWQRVYVSWTHLHKAPPYFCEIISYQVHTHSISVECKTIINCADRDKGVFPEEGNILMVKFGTKEKKGIKVLGYVTAVKVTPLEDAPPEASLMTPQHNPGDPLRVLTLTFMGAYNSEDFDHSQMIRIHVLCNVKMTLRQNDALLNSRKSPLSHNILNPGTDGLRSVTMVQLHPDPILLAHQISDCVKEIVKGILTPHPIPLLTIVKSPPASDRLLVIPKLIEKMKHHYNFKVLLCTRTPKALADIGFILEKTILSIVVIGKRADVNQKLRKYLLEDAVVQQGPVDKQDLKKAKLDLLKGADVILSLVRDCNNETVLEALNDEDAVSQLCCIIDEANFCTEPEILIPLMYGMSKLILIGDPAEPAKVCSKAAISHGYDRSLFHRAYEMDVDSD